MQIININKSYFLKQNDTATNMVLQVLGYDGLPIDLMDKHVEVVIGNQFGRLLVKDAILLDVKGQFEVGFDKGDIVPSGKQRLEVHIYEEDGSKTVAPSKGFYQIRVESSIDELQAQVNTVTLDFFLDGFAQASNRATELQNRADTTIVATEAVRVATEAERKRTETVRDETEIVRDETLELREGWKFKGNYNPSQTYDKHNVVAMAGSAYIAIQDVPVGVAPTGKSDDEYWRTHARAGADGTGTVVTHEDRFIATAGQKVFNLTHEYDQFQNRIQVIAGGVPQFSQKNYLETSPTSITLYDPVPVGAEVVVRYFSKALPLSGDAETAIANHTAVLTDHTARIEQAEMSLESVTSTLAEMTMETEQIDFVEMLQRHNEVASTLYVKKMSDRTMQVMTPFKGRNVAHYELVKDNNDDFIKLGFGKVSEVENEEISRKNYVSTSGTWTTTGSNHFTTEVGASLTATFEGSGLNFVHYPDNRGGLLKFVIDGKEVRTLSTHVDAVTADGERFDGPLGVRRIVRGLGFGTHTVVVTFMGDDPKHPPTGGVGTSRGWAKFNAGSNANDFTFRILGDELGSDTVEKFDVLHYSSNKEFALSVKPSGSAVADQWLPDHGIGTVLANEQRVYFDDKLVTTWTPESTFKPVKSVRVIQNMKGIHTSEPSSPLVNIYSVHTVSAKGVSVKVKFEFLRDTTITNGYGMMFPGRKSFTDQLISSTGKRYDAVKIDGSMTVLNENDKTNSFAFLNKTDPAKKDILVAMTINDVFRTMRHGKQGRREDVLLWLQHRNDNSIQKLYPHVFRDYTAKAGETYEISGTFFIGELPMADKLLP